ncbi:MAG: 50S ribosomal protein L13 [Candidatus Riesia sp.]|nr:50S ribosomal protein L13 [Candidatus Riesia sp.]
MLGRLASRIANTLIGKWNVSYECNQVPNVIVVVINSSKIKVTGSKMDKKFYYRHTGYPGGLKKLPLNYLLNKNPNFILKNAVKGMLPKNKLQKLFLKRLKIYDNKFNPHFNF